MSHKLELKTIAGALAVSFVKGDQPQVMAAGPLIKQKGCEPSRLVMVNWGNQISVHHQVFQVDEDVPDLAAACQKAKSSFTDGSYFATQQLADAIAKFGHKLATNSGNCVSVFHDSNF